MDWNKRVKTKEFKSLQDEWYAKLKQSGFEDVEDSETNLKQYASNAYRQADELTRDSRQRYFELLSQRCRSYRFSDPVDRAVMVLKADGHLLSEICQRLEKMGMSRHRQTVRFIIRRYENEWGIRKWKPSQMNHKPPTR